MHAEKQWWTQPCADNRSRDLCDDAKAVMRDSPWCGIDTTVAEPEEEKVALATSKRADILRGNGDLQHVLDEAEARAKTAREAAREAAREVTRLATIEAARAVLAAEKERIRQDALALAASKEAAAKEAREKRAQRVDPVDMSAEELAYERERGCLPPLDNVLIVNGRVIVDVGRGGSLPVCGRGAVRKSASGSTRHNGVPSPNTARLCVHRNGSTPVLSSVLAGQKAHRAVLSRGRELIEQRRDEILGVLIPASVFRVDEQTADFLATRAPTSLELFAAMYRLGSSDNTERSVTRRISDLRESRSATRLWDTVGDETRERLFRIQRLQEESRNGRLHTSKATFWTPVAGAAHRPALYKWPSHSGPLGATPALRKSVRRAHSAKP